MVVVGYSTNEDMVNEAFRWTEAGGMQGLGFFPNELPNDPGHSSSASDVSDDGSIIVGSATDLFGYTGPPPTGPVFGGRIAVWVNGVIGTIPNLDPESTTNGGHAYGVSRNGRYVVGESPTGTGRTEAFLHDRQTGLTTAVAAGQGNGSTAYAVSDVGPVVVGEYNTNDGDRGFVWDPGNGFRDLGEVLTGLGANLGEVILEDVQDVSADGTTLCGNASNEAENVYSGYVATLPVLFQASGRLVEQRPYGLVAGLWAYPAFRNAEAMLGSNAGANAVYAYWYAWYAALADHYAAQVPYELGNYEARLNEYVFARYFQTLWDYEAFVGATYAYYETFDPASYQALHSAWVAAVYGYYDVQDALANPAPPAP
jgi:probable HAF family extracellular repeat protein